MEFTHDSGRGQHFFFDVGNGRDAIAFFWFEDAPPPAPGIAQSGRWLPGAPRRSAIGAMDHVALDVPRDKIEAYRDKLRAKGIDVTEVVNHSDRPGIDQYLPAEPNEDTFVRSIYFQDPDGITLEFACLLITSSTDGRPLNQPAERLLRTPASMDATDESRTTAPFALRTMTGSYSYTLGS